MRALVIITTLDAAACVDGLSATACTLDAEPGWLESNGAEVELTATNSDVDCALSMCSAWLAS